jgi:DNA-binding transcriptional MocR family regulator
MGFEHIIPISSESGGISVEELEKVMNDLGSGMVAPEKFNFLLYLVPTYSNPTGSTISEEKRIQIVDLARKHNCLVVCDDV